MLSIRDICKTYKTGDFEQRALDHVSVNLRDNEFVAVLGPSGSGKTTFLNVIGGLDHYDSGDIVINGISTKKYKERDWDSYRNHTIGFVFQSYNLIPHQDVLANVELALTISGVSKADRRKRAVEALEHVGLADHIHKRPNQLSGGQMQRVAIARALVNDPEILLADEPTGALDSATSIQVMDLLKEVAEDRLVVMVTHNPELAASYANRIIDIRDGHIVGDSNPYIEEDETPAVHKNMGKSRMNFLTSLALSFSNLRTKKARTILTALAGSIGIIGISLILALSNGVNKYIDDLQTKTMASYPITIQSENTDLSGALNNAAAGNAQDKNKKKGGIYSSTRGLAVTTENNLKKFKKYLDDPKSEVNKYVGENGINYSYDLKYDAYTYNKDGTFQNTNAASTGIKNPFAGSSAEPDDFSEMLCSKENSAQVSQTVKKNYKLLSGKWPEKYNEVVLVADSAGEISVQTLYDLGFMTKKAYKRVQKRYTNNKTVKTSRYEYSDLMGKKFYLVPAALYYKKAAAPSMADLAGLTDSSGKAGASSGANASALTASSSSAAQGAGSTASDASTGQAASESGTASTVYAADTDAGNIKKLALQKGIKVKITAIVQPQSEENAASLIETPIGYTKALTEKIIKKSNESPVVKAQKADKKTNVLTGLKFGKKSEAADALTQALSGSSVLSGVSSSYKDNLEALGAVDLASPSQIEIYVDSFDDKKGVTKAIKNYNKTVDEDDQIAYTDYIKIMMSSMTKMVDVISYVLIAFVALSLIVSSIMIGIITYISVLERTKEIGILRALGASKRNISHIFDAETFIIGLLSGLLGIAVSLALLVPGNVILHNAIGTSDVNASLPAGAAAVLVVLSVVLTLIGGFIPSKAAARKDPVAALRTE